MVLVRVHVGVGQRVHVGVGQRVHVGVFARNDSFDREVHF